MAEDLQAKSGLESPRKPSRSGNSQFLTLSSYLGLVLLGGFCAFILDFLKPLWMPQIVGQQRMYETQYPGSQLLYSGYQISGNNHALRTFVLWTEDPIDEVRAHYEQFFPQFRAGREQQEPVIAYGSGVYDEDLSYSIAITLFDANLANDSPELGPYYDGNPYQILEDSPKRGTYILFSHDFDRL